MTHKLKDLLDIYYKLDRSPFTTSSYEKVLTRFANEVGPGRRIGRITYADIVDYAAELRDSGIAQSSYVQYMRIIRTFFNWCLENRFVDISPAAGLVLRAAPLDPDENRAIPKDVLERMIYLASVDPRDHALLLFLADTGSRTGGVVNLRISKLNIEERNAVTLEKGDIYHKKFFGDITAEALKVWLAHRPEADHDFVFTRRGQPYAMTRAGVQAAVYRLSIRACGKKYGPHSIRHSVGHAYSELNLPAVVTQHKLGHLNLGTTFKNYYPRNAPSLPEISNVYQLPQLIKDEEDPTPKVIDIRRFQV